jgi:lipoprotein-releasing system permease protein
VRIAGTILYSGFTLAVVAAATVSGALLIVQPHRLFPGWDLFPRQIYYLDEVPVLIDPMTVVGIVLATLFVSLVFSIYPALRAASYNPIEAIRDE